MPEMQARFRPVETAHRFWLNFLAMPTASGNIHRGKSHANEAARFDVRRMNRVLRPREDTFPVSEPLRKPPVEAASKLTRRGCERSGSLFVRVCGPTRRP